MGVAARMVTTTDVDLSANIEHRRHRAPLVFLGFFAATTSALLALLLAGEVVAALVLVIVFGGAIGIAVLAGPRIARVAVIVFTVLLIGSIGVIGYGAAQIAAALFAAGNGPADPADPAALSAAEAKISTSARDPAFHVELSETELNAVLQDALADSDNPFQHISIDITNDLGDPGRIDFEGRFKNGDLEVSGTLGAEVNAGAITLEILDVDVGMFSVPGVARDAVEEMIEDLADLEAAVADEGADIQEITIGADTIVVTGVNRAGGTVDTATVLRALGDLVDLETAPAIAAARFTPGRIDGTRAAGEPIYLALGDSLAANVGVDDATLGYVSRFHLALEEHDGVTYGLENLGVSGETSGTMLSAGQLAAAEAIADRSEVAYVTIDIGANDLLGHLASPICSEDILAPECQQRIEASITAYDRNIREIFDRLDDAFPDATVILLTTYNPFSFGYGDALTFEVQSNETLRRLNGVAAFAAAEHGFLVADGFGPMQATVTATTHFNDAPPDIHPTALGFDVLTAALFDALVGPAG